MSTPSQGHDLCTCPVCRRGIRRQIGEAFRAERRWLGYWTLRHAARLGWLPEAYYRSVIDEMLRRGLLVAIAPEDPRRDFPVYLAASIVSRPARKRGGA